MDKLLRRAAKASLTPELYRVLNRNARRNYPWDAQDKLINVCQDIDTLTALTDGQLADYLTRAPTGKTFTGRFDLSKSAGKLVALHQRIIRIAGGAQ